jgi:hypothetical protein
MLDDEAGYAFNCGRDDGGDTGSKLIGVNSKSRGDVDIADEVLFPVVSSPRCEHHYCVP